MVLEMTAAHFGTASPGLFMNLHNEGTFHQSERRRRARLWPTAQAVGRGVGFPASPVGATEFRRKQSVDRLSPLPGLEHPRRLSHGCRRGPQDSAPSGADIPAILMNNPGKTVL